MELLFGFGTLASLDITFLTLYNLVEGLEVNRPDQVWVADITYIRLRKEFVYLAVLMDVFARCIRGWHLGRSLKQELTITALRRAFEGGLPEVHHSDQGVQYAATAYVEMLTAAESQISMASVGEPKENGYAERLLKRSKGRKSICRSTRTSPTPGGNSGGPSTTCTTGSGFTRRWAT